MTFLGACVWGHGNVTKTVDLRTCRGSVCAWDCGGVFACDVWEVQAGVRSGLHISTGGPFSDMGSPLTLLQPEDGCMVLLQG